MNNAYPVTVIRACTVIISTILGIGVLSFPNFAAKAVDSGAPLLTLEAMGVSMFSLVILALLVRKFPRENIIQFSERLIGKWPARFFNLLLIIFFVICSGLSTRDFGEVVIAVLLPKTPIEVSIIIMLIVVVASSRRSVVKFSFIHSFYLPFIIIVALVIFLASLRDYDMVNLLPVIGNHPSRVVYAALSIASLFQSAFVLTLLVPYMIRPRKILASAVWGVIISGIVYLMIIISTIALFGSEETKLLAYPTLDAARSAVIPGGAFERLDDIFIIGWVVSVYTTIYSNYYFSVIAAKDLFRIRDHRLFVSYLIPIVFVIAMIPHDTRQFFVYGNLIFIYGMILTTGYPLLLLLLSLIRGVKESSQ
ncbi:endospore germination permease [Paenibacillus sepulcri]|uniref:Spore germination protein n=1 Tax=Paenibacillus sepulcri TaxID=359917 RepID=A0ABS7CEI2_9BACL|nr:spore germination protein [Paenibacillus sepulcri]